MCLILLAYNRHPSYPLILAVNRDEFYSRPTAPASFWKDAPGVLAGRDLQSGGTWLGITRSGRLAAITNFRDPSERKQGRRPRGLLVRDFLQSQIPPMVYLGRLAKNREFYRGFNLLLGDGSGLFYYSNREGSSKPLSSGLYGLSNHLLDTPWPKVAGGKAVLAALLADNREIRPPALFDLLSDASRPTDALLPDTGVGLEWERTLSSRFVTSPDYGTRSSTVLLIDKAGQVTFIERTFDRLPGEWREVLHEFRIER